MIEKNGILSFIARFVGVLLAFAVLLAAEACSSDPEFDYGDFRETFATFAGRNAEGKAVLTVRLHDDSPELQMTAVNADTVPAAVGERAFVRYTVVERLSDTESRIRIDGQMKIINGQLQNADPKKYNPTEMSVTSIWRSGSYINLNAWIPYTGKPFVLVLLGDGKVSADGVAEAFLVYDMRGAMPTFERKAYASFDVSSVWMQAGLKRLRVYVDNNTGDAYYDFLKQ